MKKIIFAILLVTLCIAAIAGYAQSNGAKAPVQPVDTQQNGDASRVMLPEAMAEKNIKLENIKSIELYDLDNKLVKTLDEKAISDAVTAYNNGIIDDTSYIEMIAGNRMVILLNDGGKINITSYGSQTNVVASTDKATYHLICPEIAKLLLEK